MCMNIHQHLYDAIFFSPHLDDAVLSAGAHIASLTAQRKRVLVATVFTQAGSAHLPGDAQVFLEKSGGGTARELFTDRKQEDSDALGILGADYVHLDYIDALFRTKKDAQTAPSSPRQLYPTFDAVFSAQINPHDQQLLAQLGDECTRLHQCLMKGGTFFAPLGIGGHIDHVLCYLAAQQIPPRDLVFWEDVPYRIEHHKVLKRAHHIGKEKLLPRNVISYTMTASAAKKKHLATRAYVSQIAALNATGLSTAQLYMERYFNAN